MYLRITLSILLLGLACSATWYNHGPYREQADLEKSSQINNLIIKYDTENEEMNNRILEQQQIVIKRAEQYERMRETYEFYEEKAKLYRENLERQKKSTRIIKKEPEPSKPDTDKNNEDIDQAMRQLRASLNEYKQKNQSQRDALVEEQSNLKKKYANQYSSHQQRMTNLEQNRLSQSKKGLKNYREETNLQNEQRKILRAIQQNRRQFEEQNDAINHKIDLLHKDMVTAQKMTEEKIQALKYQKIGFKPEAPSQDHVVNTRELQTMLRESTSDSNRARDDMRFFQKELSKEETVLNKLKKNLEGISQRKEKALEVIERDYVEAIDRGNLIFYSISIVCGALLLFISSLWFRRDPA